MKTNVSVRVGRLFVRGKITFLESFRTVDIVISIRHSCCIDIGIPTNSKGRFRSRSHQS